MNEVLLFIIACKESCIRHNDSESKQCLEKEKLASAKKILQGAFIWKSEADIVF
jgi:hypothetical protein